MVTDTELPSPHLQIDNSYSTAACKMTFSVSQKLIRALEAEGYYGRLGSSMIYCNTTIDELTRIAKKHDIKCHIFKEI